LTKGVAILIAGAVEWEFTKMEHQLYVSIVDPSRALGMGFCV